MFPLCIFHNSWFDFESGLRQLSGSPVFPNRFISLVYLATTATTSWCWTFRDSLQFAKPELKMESHYCNHLLSFSSVSSNRFFKSIFPALFASMFPTPSAFCQFHLHSSFGDQACMTGWLLSVDRIEVVQLRALWSNLIETQTSHFDIGGGIGLLARRCLQRTTDVAQKAAQHHRSSWCIFAASGWCGLKLRSVQSYAESMEGPFNRDFASILPRTDAVVWLDSIFQKDL